jgi:hypothetical protein
LVSSLSRAACLHPSTSVETSDCTSRPLLPGEVVIAWLNLRSALIGREIGTQVSVGSKAVSTSSSNPLWLGHGHARKIRSASFGLDGEPPTPAMACRAPPSVGAEAFLEKVRINAVLYQTRANTRNVEHDEP